MLAGRQHRRTTYLPLRTFGRSSVDTDPSCPCPHSLGTTRVNLPTLPCWNSRIFVAALPFSFWTCAWCCPPLAPGQDLVALVAAITAANQAAPASGNVASPEQEVDDTNHMTKNEMATLLQMCRKSSTGTLAYLPAWFQDCADKGTTDPYRQMIVQKYVMANT